MDKIKASLYKLVLQSLCVAGGLYATRTIFCYLHRKYKQYPRGPFGLPFIGSLLSCTDLSKYSSFLTSRYGGISMIYIGFQPFVFLHSIDYINEIFKNKNAVDRDWDKSLLLQHLKPWEQNTAGVSQKYWVKKRKIFQTIMTSRLDSNFINRVHNKSLDYVFKIIDKCINENRVWYSSEYLGYVQFHFIWYAVFGSFISFDNKHRENVCKLTATFLADGGKDIVLRYLGLQKILSAKYTKSLFPNYRLFSDYIEQLIYEELGYDEKVFDMNDKKWDKHFKDMQDNKNICVASKLIAAHRNNTLPKYSTKQAILSELNVFFNAGIDTNMHTSEYGIMLLAKQPEVQDKIYNELKQHIGNDWKLQNIKLSQVIAKLNYLRAFIHETLRISCVSPNGVAHYNPNCDIWLKNGKYRIPKNSVIFSDVVNANRNDSYWINKTNNNPMKICLNAWLDSNDTFKYNLNKDKMMTFGVGSRDCAGQAMALRDLYLLFLKLILNYSFGLKETDKNIEITQKFEFMFVIKPKIGIIVTKR